MRQRRVSGRDLTSGGRNMRLGSRCAASAQSAAGLVEEYQAWLLHCGRLARQAALHYLRQDCVAYAPMAADAKSCQATFAERSANSLNVEMQRGGELRWAISPQWCAAVHHCFFTVWHGASIA